MQKTKDRIKTSKAVEWEDVYRKLEAAGKVLESPISGLDREKLLRERAQKLAYLPTEPDKEEQTIEVVEFSLAYERYAFESSFVKEIYPLHELTAVPCTPAFVLGIINLRSRILSVIDLKKFFDLPDRGLSNLNKVVILGSEEMEFGVLADSITGVVNIKTSELNTGLATLNGIREEYLKGITPGRLTVLDAGRLLSDEKIVVNDTDI